MPPWRAAAMQGAQRRARTYDRPQQQGGLRKSMRSLRIAPAVWAVSAPFVGRMVSVPIRATDSGLQPFDPARRARNHHLVE